MSPRRTHTSAGPAFGGQVSRLKAQLAEIGYSPAQITYLVLSHYHDDHATNKFAGSLWLASPIGREAMFAEKVLRNARPDTYSALRNCKRFFGPSPAGSHADFRDVLGKLQPRRRHVRS